MLDFTDETAPHEIAFEAYGTKARVCTNAADLLTRVEQLLPPGWERTSATPEHFRLGIVAEDEGTYSVYQGMAPVSQDQGLEISLTLLDGQIRGYVALNAPDLTFVHAGAVAHEGRAMIFPGLSFAGKTTLVAALVRAGAVYYSDEFAVLDADGLLHPYAKPLSLRPERRTGQSEHPVEHLGGTAGEEPLRLQLAVVTSYRPGAEWRPKRLSPGEAALSLLAHTVTARSRPDAAMRTISRALEHAVALEGDRGEAEELAKHLLSGASPGYDDRSPDASQA